MRFSLVAAAVTGLLAGSAPEKASATIVVHDRPRGPTENTVDYRFRCGAAVTTLHVKLLPSYEQRVVRGSTRGRPMSPGTINLINASLEASKGVDIISALCYGEALQLLLIKYLEGAPRTVNPIRLPPQE